MTQSVLTLFSLGVIVIVVVVVDVIGLAHALVAVAVVAPHPAQDLDPGGTVGANPLPDPGIIFSLLTYYFWMKKRLLLNTNSSIRGLCTNESIKYQAPSCRESTLLGIG